MESKIETRFLKSDEIRLLKFLMNRANMSFSDDIINKLLVIPCDDGDMGSLLFSVSSDMLTKDRSLGKKISECEFEDLDGVKVIASLNVDDSGNLFELDIWKVNFTPLKQMPKIFI